MSQVQLRCWGNRWWDIKPGDLRHFLHNNKNCFPIEMDQYNILELVNEFLLYLLINFSVQQFLSFRCVLGLLCCSGLFLVSSHLKTEILDKKHYFPRNIERCTKAYNSSRNVKTAFFFKFKSSLVLR